MLSERDQTIVAEREDGASYEQIAARHGLSLQRIGVICARARQQIDGIELDLLRSVKTGEYPTLLVPYGPSYSMALSYCQWVQDSLRERDVRFRLITRQSKAGTAFQFEPVFETTQEQQA